MPQVLKSSLAIGVKFDQRFLFIIHSTISHDTIAAPSWDFLFSNLYLLAIIIIIIIKVFVVRLRCIP